MDWFLLLVCVTSLAHQGAADPSVFVYELPDNLNVAWSKVAFESESEATQKYAMMGDGFAKTEIILHQELLESSLRTMSPDSATLFFVPVYTAILVHHEHLDIAEGSLLQAVELLQGLDSWSKSRGADHIFMFMHPSGPCTLKDSTQKLLMKAIILHAPGAPATCDLVQKQGVAVPLFAQSLLPSAIEQHFLKNSRKKVFSTTVNVELFSFCAPDCVSSELEDPDERAEEVRLLKKEMLKRMAESDNCVIDDLQSHALLAAVLTDCLPIVPEDFDITTLPLPVAARYDDFVSTRPLNKNDPSLRDMRASMKAVKTLLVYGEVSLHFFNKYH